MPLYEGQWRKLVQSTVNHPAVAGYILGNEIFGGARNSKSQFWKNYGRILNAAYLAGVSVSNPPFLIAAINDDVSGQPPNLYWPVIQAGTESGQIGHLGGWAINVYRGPTFGEPGNSPIPQYRHQMNNLGKKPLLIGEFGTPHSTRTPEVYLKGRQHGAPGTPPVVELDTIAPDQFGQGRPYEGGRGQGDFLTGVWNVIKHDYSRPGAESTVSGGFVFNWCDEWYKHGGDPNVHAGGPNIDFAGSALAGGYWDEKWFGVTDSLPQSVYNGSKDPIRRAIHTGYNALKSMYK
jgi:hypothetical protein